MRTYRPLFALLLFLLPIQSLFASVSISEVAWMGSSTSANHEWIELFNSGDSVSIDGWTLSDGGNLTIALVGTIPAGAYVVLERNRSDGGSVVGTPFMNYSGALVNTGATLTLRRADGSIVDQVAGGENWQNIGGNNTTKDTAQYTSNGWITGVPTPGRVNATTPSPTPTGSSTSAKSPQLILYGTPVTSVSTKSITAPLSLQISAPSLIYAGQPVALTVIPSGMTQTIRNSLKYQWNFGDLHTSTSSAPTHTYTYPGTYNVVVQASFASYRASARLELAVLPLTVSLSHSQNGDVLLHNNAMYEVDISEHYLVSSLSKTIPLHTYISPRETITIPWRMVANAPFPATLLLGRGREVITSTTDTPKETSMVITDPLPLADPQPVAMGVVAEDESLSPPAFGFARAVAYDGQAEVALEGEDKEEGEGSGDGVEQGDAFGVTPILTPSTTHSSTSATWWIYLIFIALLLVAITTLYLRPTDREEK